MKKHLYASEQFLPIDIDRAWSFFSSAKNLSVITPPDLNFEILTDLDGNEIYKGMLIDYKVSPLPGMRVHWITEIAEVDKPFSFMDRQLKGPYKTWEHRHEFIQKKGGVLMKDLVTYQLPFGIIGSVVHALVVRRKLHVIFNFRKMVLEKLFIPRQTHTV